MGTCVFVDRPNGIATPLTPHVHTLQSVHMVNSTRLLPAPTLWRTCRALANRRRLRLMQYLMRHSDLTVSAIADEARMPLSVASQYLRALNARGLLQARRVGRSVIYRVEADPAVPQAEPLLKALRASRREGTPGAKRPYPPVTE